MRRYTYTGPMLSHAEPEPFTTAEEAWLWYAQCQLAREEGARLMGRRGQTARPCEPDDIVREVTRLRQSRKLDAVHVRVLASFGSRLTAPSAAHGERQALLYWEEALDRLSTPLRAKGIVA